MTHMKRATNTHLGVDTATHRVRLLTVSGLVMFAITIIVIVVTLWFEYSASLEQQRGMLVNIAKSNARMIEAIARFDSVQDGNSHSDRDYAATLMQIKDAYGRLGGLGRTGELALARLRDGVIEFLIEQRYGDVRGKDTVPMASTLAEPMRQALLGRSGTILGLDYRGMEVLAAFEPVLGMDMGIVAKVDYAEIRAPHIRAGLIALAVGFVVMMTGIALLYRFADPLVRQINQASARFRDFADTASDWYWETDQRYAITYVSDRYLELLGVSREGVIGQPLNKLMGSMANEYADVSSRSDDLNGGTGDRKVYWKSLSTIKDRVGNEHYITISGKPYVDEHGTVLGFRGTGSDITSQMKAEKSYKAFKNTLDRVLDCVFMFDPETLKFTYVNQGAIEHVRYTYDELMKMTPIDLQPEFNEEMFRMILDPMISGEKTVEKFETVHRTKNGVSVPVEIFLQYVSSRDEKPQFVSIVRDITERQRADEERAAVEQALNDSQKMEALGHLSGGMAHEFNNMLVPIIGLTELTISSLPEDSDEHENLEIALDAAMRARELIEQILLFSRSEGRTLEPVDFAKLISQGIKILRASLPTQVIVADDLSQGEGTQVICEPTEINQILMNLGKNAADAIGEKGGHIMIKLDTVDLHEKRAARIYGVTPGTYAKFEVRDDGCGMSRETQMKIFNPFYTTKEVGSGTGMGLSMVHGLVKNYGGAVHVRSALGKGTTFEVLLPSYDADKEVIAEPVRKKGGLLRNLT